MHGKGLAAYSRLVAISLMAVLSCAFLSGCAAGSDGTGASGDSANRAAATIMGETITEQQVSDYVTDLRASTLRVDDDSWREYLVGEGMSAQDIRKIAIDELASTIVIRHEAQERGIVADEEAVDGEIEAMRTSLGATDDGSWAEALSSYRLDPDELRETFVTKSLREQLYNTVVDEVEPADDDIESYIGENLLGQTMKKLTLVSGTDYPSMTALLEAMLQAASGEDAIALARERAADGSVSLSDYGWYFPGTASAQMESIISELEGGGVYDELLPNDGVFQILYVEDTYSFSDVPVDLGGLPEGLAAELAVQVEPDVREEACNEWLHSVIDENIVVYDMPDGLPYDVDMGSQGEKGAG